MNRMIPSDHDVAKDTTNDCQQTPLSHHIHLANVLLNISNDLDDDGWNVQALTMFDSLNIPGCVVHCIY